MGTIHVIIIIVDQSNRINKSVNSCSGCPGNGGECGVCIDLLPMFSGSCIIYSNKSGGWKYEWNFNTHDLLHPPSQPPILILLLLRQLYINFITLGHLSLLIIESTRAQQKFTHQLKSTSEPNLTATDLLHHPSTSRLSTPSQLGSKNPFFSLAGMTA